MDKTQKSSSRAAIHGVGRRKTAVARVWVTQGSSESILINGLSHKEYFDTSITRAMIEAPLKATGLEKKFTISVNVNGGGLVGQAEATRLGIARALLASNEALKPVLKENSLLTVDSRVKERKKYGQKAARRKFQFTKR